MNTQVGESNISFDIESCIERLPTRVRILFVLHIIEGYQYEEIFTVTDIAAVSSKMRLHLAKHLLKGSEGV